MAKAKGVLLDLGGVVYEGDDVLPGAADAIARLHAGGIPLRFLTNTTRSPKQRILERLHRFGVEASVAEIFTPSQAARTWLIAHNLTPFLVVYPDLVEEFAGVEGTNGEAVVIGDVGEALTYDQLNTAFRRLMAGAEFLALANNRTFKDRDGELSLDAGAFVAALAFATERKPHVLGKPSPDFFATALASMGCPTQDAVMIGDDAESDVAGALSAGLGQAVLVRTGKYRPGDETRVTPAPTTTVADLSEAVAWLLGRS